jgi:hypothetical protein
VGSVAGSRSVSFVRLTLKVCAEKTDRVLERCRCLAFVVWACCGSLKSALKVLKGCYAECSRYGRMILAGSVVLSSFVSILVLCFRTHSLLIVSHQILSIT